MSKNHRGLPPEFVERLNMILPSSKRQKIIDSFARLTPTTFRVNRLKSHSDILKDALQSQGLKIRRVPWYRDAFVLENASIRDLQNTREYSEGHLYIQSLSSMVPPLVLEPQPEETVLDMTAAPGSKTTQMAAMMEARGRLVANDNNKVRFFKLKANVEMQGASNVELNMYYGEGFGKKQPETYDRVLLDAPCSAEGRFYIHKPASFGFWKPRKVKEMAHKQKKLIHSAIETLKPGGLLVYSTCTFSPEENEGVLDFALKKFPDKIEIEKAGLDIPNQMTGISEWEGNRYDPAVKRGVRILPDETMEGFFVAKIRKSLGH
ncbi:MAG: RsmB/NOP family class I SAM-dependent RNA methyltransferase [Candidatus Omnitrophica bacterium]|nr:RsmB/NOP family class I SAM-dependent RNA methyltransferase [Candidatus Omnitrophota bacterium]